MPQLGACADEKCDDKIKELYECHCCLRLVCLSHLNTHLEIRKQTQELDNIRNELYTAKNQLKSIVEEQMLIIKHKQDLITQAEQCLDASNSSLDELRNLVENIHQEMSLSQSGKH
ncbi:unnamed protein product [Rotaria sp. Silwood1]|nr:unnamed protein product [Rotaria sp. Silwood1]CAF1640001.1 unnamed protein product [Rotaria sp. Silwood1]CAF3832541.1 unnamed protein product [Rotaria sp. Silwood1]CAF3876184.1 unnamed protein product [Rotaria sp. Silwood1]CAF4854529.1 unnamed protein product [Rotaria sp. Silwood1]